MLAVAIGLENVGASLDQRAQRRDMARTAIAEHDRLDHRIPMEILDMAGLSTGTRSMSEWPART